MLEYANANELAEALHSSELDAAEFVARSTHVRNLYDESGSWYGCLIRVETGGGIMTIDTVAQQVLEPFGGAYTEYEDGTGLQDYCAYLESLD